VIVEALGKVNLSLHLRVRDASGYHPIRSLVQSVDWSDSLTLQLADADRFTVDGDMPADESNLAWRAMVAARCAAGVRRGVALHLVKRIPVAAGLGGGSADAAAGLVGTSRLLGLDPAVPERLALGLGADVPFCVVGGTAWMEGRGERVTPVSVRPSYALAVAVPPFEMSTSQVYRRWDDLGGPAGTPMEVRHLPPSLRGLDDLANDLSPAAVDLRPDLGDWLTDLATGWGRPVLLTGSGPAAFGFFSDLDEATDAAAAAASVRATWAGGPASGGWRVVG
jgi:4-diphosphocytidyl-2-C-methyl-D-erythritol kinase